jgi:putative FmdB family regulatory protein
MDAVLPQAARKFYSVRRKTTMPLYDIRCTSCDGIFEKRLTIASLHSDIDCPYCEQSTKAAPQITSSRVAMNSVERWKPQSLAQQLAGNGIAGPGTKKNAMRSSVLHNCKGVQCSVCET